MIATLWIAAPAPAPAAPLLAQAETPTVWCHDERLAIVKRKERWRCEGTIVSDEEAKRIKQARVQRIQRVLERERNPVVPDKKLAGTGTGFFVSARGHVLTNHHVVKACEAITVAPALGGELVAQVRSADPARDLALLETGRASPEPARFRDFDEVIANEPVTVVGYPLHGRVVIKPVLVAGHVHADGATGNPHVFAMNVDIRRGNSGGPVLDDAGRVVGVVFAEVDTPAVYARTGKLVRDVGLALRIALVRDFLRPLEVEMLIARDEAKLAQQARFQRAREFVVQIGCWR